MKNRLSHLLNACVFSTISAIGLATPQVFAEDLATILKRVQELHDQKNYSKALEELAWAQKELEKSKSKVTEGLFPNDVMGYAGGKIENSGAFGFSNIERTYTKGSETIKVSLTESKGGGQNPLGGLAALGQMAAMMGNQPGVDTFRIDGRTATLESQENDSSLTVFLNGGGIIKFEQSGSNNGATLKEFAGQFKLSEFEKAS
jgi:hypothetical protein